MELKCTKCLEVKPSTEFYKRKTTARGFRSHCKSCMSSRCKGYYEVNKPSIRVNMSTWQKTNPQKRELIKKRYQLKYPEKMKAKAAANKAVASGKLSKPDHCSKCLEVKTSRQIHGHHWSYLKENWLDVVWVCHSCHVAIHNGEAL